jgi:hypothetical protein
MIVWAMPDPEKIAYAVLSVLEWSFVASCNRGSQGAIFSRFDFPRRT